MGGERTGEVQSWWGRDWSGLEWVRKGQEWFGVSGGNAGRDRSGWGGDRRGSEWVGRGQEGFVVGG